MDNNKKILSRKANQSKTAPSVRPANKEEDTFSKAEHNQLSSEAVLNTEKTLSTVNDNISVSDNKDSSAISETAVATESKIKQETPKQSANTPLKFPLLGDAPMQSLEATRLPITLEIDALVNNEKGLQIIGALYDPERRVRHLGLMINPSTKMYLPFDPQFPGVTVETTIRPDLVATFGLTRDAEAPQGFIAQLPCRVQGSASLVLVLVDGSVLVTQCNPFLRTDIKGLFERCDAAGIEGWLALTDSDERLVVEIIADGQPIGRAIAENYRGDLEDAKVGDGLHGFLFTPPTWLIDSKVHKIEVRDLKTGLLLPGTPKTFQASQAITRSSIELEGSALVGQVSLADDAESTRLCVLENGQIISVGSAEIQDGDMRFHLPLPTHVFDGRAHLFSVRSESGIHFGDLAIITPYMATPESALQQYVREGLKPALSSIAGFRYESLLGAISKLAKADNPAEPLTDQIEQLVRAHDQIVRGFTENDKVFTPLNFPYEASPRVSIIIPVHNKFPVTYHCLASLLIATNQASFEVIIVDDGSKDVSSQIPVWIKGIQYLRNDEPQGFIRACNRGGAAARGEYIVMLNNDTEVTAHWLDELLATFEHFDNVGMAGAKLLYPNGTLQEAGGIVWNTGDPWNYGRQANPHDPRYCYARQVDFLSGACLMLPSVLWSELGGFDENFVPAYFEDTDLAFRIRDKGYKTVYSPFSQVIHFEGMSNGTTISSGIKQYQEINRPKFKQRWAGFCRHNGDVGVDVDLNKDRNVEIRALVIDAETPMPDKNAGSYAAIQEMRMLQALGFKCTFIPLNVAWMGHYTEDLQRMGVECLFAPFTCSVQEVLEKRGKEFDIIYITRYYVAQHYIDAIRHYAPQAKIVMMNADLHFLRELRAAVEKHDGEQLSKALETRDNELLTMREVDLVLVYTEVEKAVILTHNLNSTNVAKCPWITEVLEESSVPSYDQRLDIAFLGGFSHHPNVEAVEWFAKKVMPLMHTELPGVKFRVYGSNMPNSLMALAEKDDQIIMEGWVPTVDQVYHTCRVFIAPLQSGAGIKGKVIGALAYGVPCVLSPVAAEGIAQGRIAEKPEDWVTAITELYQNPQIWTEASKQALVFSRNQYGFDKGVAQMQEALQQAEIFTTTHNNALVWR
jgi:GT2 family glycosyltransferase/glycosyltransferase involved in cell wall biosynthesis